MICESRLELGRLLFADLDPLLHGVVAQPFQLKVEVKGQVRKHIPDYSLLTENRPVGSGCQAVSTAARPGGVLHVRVDPAGDRVA
ncbi:hypothetical protein AB0M68_41450 [Streptomyces sp. NPDC051453]|uniref:hypothetical protein n=1 Tax=Streptomyces sp. NPDC051453 TaxID=3154941 RepID=UPI00343B287F